MRRISAACCARLVLTAAVICQTQSASGETIRQPPGARSQSVFDRAAVIIAAKVTSRCEVAPGDTVEYVVNQALIQFGTDAPDVIRLNNRQNTDPDPSSGDLTILQSRNARFIELTLGEGYLLLLNPAPISRMLKLPNPFYVFAEPQGGFRIDASGRLVPLVSGGELDAYRGRLLREVITEIQRRPKAPGELQD